MGGALSIIIIDDSELIIQRGANSLFQNNKCAFARIRGGGAIYEDGNSSILVMEYLRVLSLNAMKDLEVVPSMLTHVG